MRKIIFYSLFTLFSIGYFYLFLPTINFGYYAIAIYILLALGTLYFNEITKKRISEYYKMSIAIQFSFWLYIPIFFSTIFFTTSALLKSDYYKSVIGVVKEGSDISQHLAPISIEEIAIVDRQTAYRLGDKVMGSVPSLGSQTQLGNFTLQKVDNKLCWVAPLLHSGYFKWKENKEGTPGYIVVSATNDRDVKLVQNVNGKDIRIKYQPNSFFSDNLSRHIYFNGYYNRGITDFTFELDDANSPYWVITLYSKTIGFSGSDATGVITVNPQSGEIKEYDIENAPQWIDRIQPANFVIEQLNDWGEYINGYWNLSNQDKLTTTNGVTIVFGPDNQAYWYTGLTSVGKDEGTVGFALINTRTKETIWYKQVGATEEAAQLSAMGKVQEKRYEASFPVTYNINGIPTYIMSLKDRAGLIKMIAMVSVEDYTIVGVGGTLKETLRSYKNVLNSTGNAVDISSDFQLESIEDVIQRINSDNRDGDTFYYFTTENHAQIFVGTSSLSTDLVLTKEKDSVSFEIEGLDQEVIDVVSFKNKDLKKRQ